jgi:hypothetical protein
LIVSKTRNNEKEEPVVSKQGGNDVTIELDQSNKQIDTITEKTSKIYFAHFHVDLL